MKTWLRSKAAITRIFSSKVWTWTAARPLYFKVLIIPLVAGFFGMTMLLIGLCFAPLPDESIASPTMIENADGQPIAQWTLRGTRAEQTPLSEIPLDLQNATIAVEDVKFYHHHAFNPQSVARALAVDIAHGRIVEGGSTITQQLAKNLFLNEDRTMMRKLREALYAIQLELHETKQTILDQYLNAVYYGHGAYGVGAAAKLYFNKPVSRLTLPECALLAGLTKGPSLYSPFDDYSQAKTRQFIVLNRMVAAHFISQKEADKAYKTPLELSTLQEPLDHAPYFIGAAVQEVQHRFQLSMDELYQGDVSILTTLDPVLQHAAERAIATTIGPKSDLEAALVALDPQTGAVKAMVGGKNFRTSPYNRVFAERQPGSTFKAILYSAALEQGWVPNKQVNSEETTFTYDKEKSYTVHDYNDIYANRPITLREALARSDNVYAVTTNESIGPENVVNMAHRLGITTNLEPFPSLALGVFPVSPMELAAAYATLANGGSHVAPYTVSEVRAARNNELYQTSPTKKRVISRQVAFQMTDLLRSVMEPYGTGYGVHQYLHHLAAAKTGTTKTDAWMVGYNPNIVCAVWVGYDDNQPLSLTESHLAAPIWAKFMGTAEQRLDPAWYNTPDGLVRRSIDPLTGKLATAACRTTEIDYFITGTEPTEYCPLHSEELTPSTSESWLRQRVAKWLPKWL